MVSWKRRASTDHQIHFSPFLQSGPQNSGSYFAMTRLLWLDDHLADLLITAATHHSRRLLQPSITTINDHRLAIEHPSLQRDPTSDFSSAWFSLACCESSSSNNISNKQVTSDPLPSSRPQQQINARDRNHCTYRHHH